MRPALILPSCVFPELLADPSVHRNAFFPPGTVVASSISVGAEVLGAGGGMGLTPGGSGSRMRGPEVGAANLLGVNDEQGRSAGDGCHNPGEITTPLRHEALGQSLHLSESCHFSFILW